MKAQKIKTVSVCSRKKNKPKLLVYRSVIKTYHPLKYRKVRLDKIKATPALSLDTLINTTRNMIEQKDIDSHIRKDIIVCSVPILIDWMTKNGFNVKHISNNLFSLNGKVCSLSYVLLCANKQRIKDGLLPIIVEDMNVY